MVKKDEVRIQKMNKHLQTIEKVNNNVRLLSEILLYYSKEDSSEADKEHMKELFDQCENKKRMSSNYPGRQRTIVWGTSCGSVTSRS